MANKIIVIGRDSFARHDVIRQKVENTAGGCSWCGRTSAKGNLYQYGTEPDDNPSRRGFAKGKFCSVGCKRSYHCE